jgi:hypothetical protein
MANPVYLSLTAIWQKLYKMSHHVTARLEVYSDHSKQNMSYKQ